jgi:hypothetical protein
MTSDSSYTNHRYPLPVPGISSSLSFSHPSFPPYFSIILSFLSVHTSIHQPTIGYRWFFAREESGRGVKLPTHLHLVPGFFFFFYYLGPVCFSSGSTSAFKAYCATLNSRSAQIHYPCVSYKETEVLSEAVLTSFGSTNGFPKIL